MQWAEAKFSCRNPLNTSVTMIRAHASTCHTCKYQDTLVQSIIPILTFREADLHNLEELSHGDLQISRSVLKIQNLKCMAGRINLGSTVNVTSSEEQNKTRPRDPHLTNQEFFCLWKYMNKTQNCTQPISMTPKYHKYAMKRQEMNVPCFHRSLEEGHNAIYSIHIPHDTQCLYDVSVSVWPCLSAAPSPHTNVEKILMWAKMSLWLVAVNTLCPHTHTTEAKCTRRAFNRASARHLPRRPGAHWVHHALRLCVFPHWNVTEGECDRDAAGDVCDSTPKDMYQGLTRDAPHVYPLCTVMHTLFGRDRALFMGTVGLPAACGGCFTAAWFSSGSVSAAGAHRVRHTVRPGAGCIKLSAQRGRPGAGCIKLSAHRGRSGAGCIKLSAHRGRSGAGCIKLGAHTVRPAAGCIKLGSHQVRHAAGFTQDLLAMNNISLARFTLFMSHSACVCNLLLGAFVNGSEAVLGFQHQWGTWTTLENTSDCKQKGKM